MIARQRQHTSDIDQGEGIAVVIPCYNEAPSIGAVVRAFRAEFPHAEIYVYDNNSNDRTDELATAAGAIVRRERLQGKGNVIRRMFADVDADIYILVDGDNTYEAASAPEMVTLLLRDSLDLVNGRRCSTTESAYRAGHKFGNVMLNSLVSSIFGNRIDDMLSGLKVFSRRYVKSFPCLSVGYEIETELTIHALELRMAVGEIDVPYRERAAGSFSKLNTVRDGFRIVNLILKLLRAERPLLFFGMFSLVLALVSSALGVELFVEYYKTGLVPKLPTAVLATGLMIVAALGAVCGVITETVTLGRLEIKRMTYLSIPAPLLREEAIAGSAVPDS